MLTPIEHRMHCDNRRMNLNERIDQLINRSLDSTAGRLFWALLSLDVIYAVGFYAAALIGGIA